LYVFFLFIFIDIIFVDLSIVTVVSVFLFDRCRYKKRHDEFDAVKGYIIMTC